MRLLVTGSRLWDNALVIGNYLNEMYWLHSDLIIVHGDCPKGADYYAMVWATLNAVPQERYPADWAAYGKAAGHIRNKQMVDTDPDTAAAFIKGESRGTKNCISHLERAGIPYDRFEEFENGAIQRSRP